MNPGVVFVAVGHGLGDPQGSRFLVVSDGRVRNVGNVGQVSNQPFWEVVALDLKGGHVRVDFDVASFRHIPGIRLG